MNVAVRAAAVALAAVTLSCAPRADAPTTDPVFRVGVLSLFDGMKSDGSGRPTLEGARMAAAELNEAGGIEIGGVRHRVEIVARRHSFRVEDATTAARTLINQDSVHAIVGPQYSQHAVPVGAIAEQTGVPMISPMSSSPATTEGRSYVFRIAYLDAAQGEVLARYAWETLGLRRVAVVRSLTSPYSADVADRFVEVFRELGGEVPHSSFPGGGDEVVQAAFLDVVDEGPARVLLPLQTEEVAAILRLMEEDGIEMGLLGTDSWDTALLEGHASLRDAYVALQWMWTMPDSVTAEFAQRYRTDYGAPPRSTAAVTYDALRILALAADAAGSLEGARIRDAILDLPPFQGVSGRIHFDGSHDPGRPVVISRIDDGRTTFVTAVAAP